MTRCSWASCTAPATSQADSWPFCWPHRDEHEDMNRRGELPGQELPLTKDVDPRPNSQLTREQLLRAVLEESRRPVPPPAWQIDKERTDRMRNHRGRRRPPASYRVAS